MAGSSSTGIGAGQAEILANAGIGTAVKPKPALTNPASINTGKIAPKVSPQDLAEILAQACKDYGENGGSIRVGNIKLADGTGTSVAIILAGDFYCSRHGKITVASTSCQHCHAKSRSGLR